jgi:hypothetical protein
MKLSQYTFGPRHFQKCEESTAMNSAIHQLSTDIFCSGIFQRLNLRIEKVSIFYMQSLKGNSKMMAWGQCFLHWGPPYGCVPRPKPNAFWVWFWFIPSYCTQRLYQNQNQTCASTAWLLQVIKNSPWEANLIASKMIVSAENSAI